MVASGVAAGVVSDATVRDEDAVSGISNGYKYRLIKLLRVLHSCKSPISESTRNEQFHMKKSMKNTQCECSDDLALVWLVLEHLARLKQTVVGLNVLPPQMVCLWTHSLDTVCGSFRRHYLFSFISQTVRRL